MELGKTIKAVVLQILKDYYIPNEIDTEFKKKLEKDINVFQNYVNYQMRRREKTRKKREIRLFSHWYVRSNIPRYFL